MRGYRDIHLHISYECAESKTNSEGYGKAGIEEVIHTQTKFRGRGNAGYWDIKILKYIMGFDFGKGAGGSSRRTGDHLA